MRCKAKAKQRQAQCRLPAVPGMEVCRFHGGKTPRGPASATFRTGRYSKFVPSRMLADYQAAATDPKLMELRGDIATVDARIIDLLKRVDTGEAGSIWIELQSAWDRLARAQARADADTYKIAFDDVARLVNKGGEDTAAWTEIFAMIDQRRKLVVSESRRLETMHQMLSIEKAMLLLANVVDIIKRHVPDRQVLNAIAIDVQRLGEVGQAAYGLPHDDVSEIS
jgi:hypothetical protein